MRLKAAAAGLAAIVLAACSATEETASTAAWEGGAKFDKATLTSVADLSEALKDKQVQIEGTVRGVCKGRGCWVEVDDGKGKTIAKSLNDSILFPKDCVGKRVLVQGVVRVMGAAREGEGSGSGDGCPQPEILVEIQGAKLFAAK
ncbi:MAG: hypothetical protein FD180_3948 [Planctomycetota bacterium]|nr:MAG: hypothetical protein FD180_3948 [Planctomycetota bacterium]